MSGFDTNFEQVVNTLSEGICSSHPTKLILEKCEIKKFKNFYKHTKDEIIALRRNNSNNSSRSITLEPRHIFYLMKVVEYQQFLWANNEKMFANNPPNWDESEFED